MKNKVIVRLGSKESIYDRKLENIRLHACPGILPASLIYCGNSKSIIYNTTGYVNVSHGPVICAYDILMLLRTVLKITEDMKNYLFFPGEYVLTSDTVFVSDCSPRVALVYIPCTVTDEVTSFIRLIQSFKVQTTENGRMYLNMVSDEMKKRNPKTVTLFSFIEELMAEVKMCGIK